MKTILTTLALASFAFANDPIWKQEYDDFNSLNTREIFMVWKKDFDRNYKNIEDEANHYATFVNNLKMITEHNNKDLSYKMRLNQFGDLTGDEFRQTVHGNKGSCLKQNSNIIKISTNPSSKINSNQNINKKDILKALPESVDWTTQGVVTPVKNQGSCGSCWAFSATGSTECRVAIATKVLNSLSEQQLVDCSTSEGNEGCNGGLMDDAFKYIEKNGGLCSETEYPYKGVDGTCASSSCGTKYNPIASYSDVTTDDDTALATSVAAGCTSVAIEADQSSFQFYSSGILTGNCGTNLDHGVLAVGYGTSGDQEYWKVKNSWGTSWGEEGYVLICRNCDKNGLKGECGINMEPSFPVN